MADTIYNNDPVETAVEHTMQATKPQRGQTHNEDTLSNPEK